MFLLIPLARTIFDATGHDPSVRQHEITYFQILSMGVIPVLLSSTVSCFYTGQGKTWPVFYINAFGTLVNIVLDYALIFGKFGLPQMGIAGAAWATNIACICTATIYLWLFLRSGNRAQFNSLRGAKPDGKLFLRLMRFGLPTGVQFMLDILAFTLFIALVGRIDKLSLTASSMAFQINMLSFMPMIGFGIAVTTLVGQSLGRNDPDQASRYTWSAFYMTFSYMILIGLGYWLLPDLFLYPFKIKSDAAEFAAAQPIAVKLLCFVAFYCMFDTGNIIFASTLKGAGDTKFVMMVPVVLSWTVLVIPTYLAVRLDWGLYVAWAFATTYVCLLSVVFFVRFLQGKWKTMRVIEVPSPHLPTKVPELPTLEVET
jgi:MATE family multidrug resistance protein